MEVPGSLLRFPVTEPDHSVTGRSRPMKTNRRTTAITVFVTACLSIGVLSYAQHQHPPLPRKSSSAIAGKIEPGAQKIHEIMMRMAKQTMASKVPHQTDTDKTFGLMMADHHQSGVEMAKAELRYGNDPAMKAIARKILSTQTKEIRQLRKLAAKAK